MSGLPTCERCGGRGEVERQAYRDAAEEAGWLIEMQTFDADEGPLPTAWAAAGTYTFGPTIPRQQVPAGAVYEHGREPGKLWLNDEPHLMASDGGPFATTFRVATIGQQDGDTSAGGGQ